MLSGGATLWEVDTSASLLVNDGTTLSIGDTLTNTGTIMLASAGGATDLLLQSLFDNAPLHSTTRTITLLGDGSIILSDNPANLIGPTRSTDTLINQGNTISGAGGIGGGSAMGLINRGVIDATGTNALIIDIATGKATNGVRGVLEATGAGGLSISGGTISNIGTIAALDGSAVTFGAGASLTNETSMEP